MAKNKWLNKESRDLCLCWVRSAYSALSYTQFNDIWDHNNRANKLYSIVQLIYIHPGIGLFTSKVTFTETYTVTGWEKYSNQGGEIKIDIQNRGNNWDITLIAITFNILNVKKLRGSSMTFLLFVIWTDTFWQKSRLDCYPTFD